MRLLCALLLLPVAAHADAPLPEPPVPPRIASGEQYERCLAMLADDPSGAAALAEGAGSGAGPGPGSGPGLGMERDGAAHCAALAAIELGDVATGARALDALAASSPAAPLARAQILAQAVQAWLLASDAGRANDSASRALDLAPDDVDLLIARAGTLIGLERQPDAIDDLDRALQLDPARADALVLRAGALRHERRLDRAMTDAMRAVALDPDSVDALLERGILRERMGDRTGAKADWTRVIDLDPDGEAADLAQQDLALLEAGPEQRPTEQATQRPEQRATPNGRETTQAGTPPPR